MADTDTEQDPSIEEILQSIREIISEDDEEAVVEDAQPEVDLRPAEEDIPEPQDLEAPAEDQDEEILDLTEKVEEDVPEIIMDDPPEEEEVFVDTSMDGVDGEDLISEPAKAASLHALGKLSDNMYVEKQTHMAGITLEDITRDLMRPILKEWLDNNLPDLIEKIVQKEIQKITKDLK